MEGQGRADLGLVISNASELSLIFFLKKFYLYIYMCGFAHMSAVTHSVQKRELELLVLISLLTMCWGLNLGLQ